MTVYLVDKSAWEWARRDAAARDLSELLEAGHILAGSDLTALEMAYSTRNADDHATIIARQRASRWLPVTEAVMDRALEIVARLASRGHHRTPSPMSSSPRRPSATELPCCTWTRTTTT